LFGQGQTIAHEGRCKGCGFASLHPMHRAVLVGWSMVWQCSGCGYTNRKRLRPRVARRMKQMFHRPGGTRISPDELAVFMANLGRVDEAVKAELCK
jgi:hypothetical protein